MSSSPNDTQSDPTWQTAWAWVRRQHAGEGALDAAASAELAQWLAADPMHRQTYAEAARLWLLVGQVPPAHDVPSPDAEDAAR
ncbi:FecR/PupR family sigma factor regulator [Variovorax boronicumulans]